MGHSGPNVNISKQCRTLDAILLKKERGEIVEQHAKLDMAYQSFRDMHVVHFVTCADLLEEVILGRAAPVVAPPL